MQIFRIVGIAVLGATLAVTIRSFRPELSMLVAIATGVIVLLCALNELTGLLDSLRALADSYGLDTGYIGTLLKIMGVAYAAQFGAQICTDAGESAIAGKVELFGRILILAAAMPAVATTLGSAMQLLRSLP